MKLLSYIEKPEKNNSKEELRPSLSQQVKEFITETRLKIEKKDRSFMIKAGILIFLYLWVTGMLTSVFRYFGEMATLGFNESPKPTWTPWGAIAALFSFKYSLIAILLTLIIALAIMIWWIKKHIGLGQYELEERGGMRYKKQSMDGSQGSARFMTPEEMVDTFSVIPNLKGYMNPGTILFGRDPDTGDYVLEKEIKDGDMPNRHTLTIGAAGSWKSSNYIIPMIMQLSRSGDNLIINDSSGELSKAVYYLLESRGYCIKIFSILNPNASDGWNIIGAVGTNHMLARSYAKTIVDSAQGKGVGDPFWPEGMYVLLTALILYVNTTENNTIEEIQHILTTIQRADDAAVLFQNLPNNHPAKRDFNTFMTSPVKQNVWSGLGQRLSIFNSSEISRICSSEGIDIIKDLTSPDQKTAIFIVTSAQNLTFSFIPTLFLTTVVEQLSDYVPRYLDDGSLPKAVNFIMDEFANTGQVEYISQYLATTRKFGINFHLIIQSLPQFYERYEENKVDDIIGNCQYILCFGIREPKTGKYFEEFLGPTTVRSSMTQSNSVVLQETSNFREGETQRSFYYINEFIQMDPTEFLLLTGGKPPLKLKKVFWKDLEDYQYVKDFKMRMYEPKYAEYKPTVNVKVKASTSPSSTHINTSSEYETASLPIQSEDRGYRKTNENGKKRGERKNKKPSTFDNTPPMFQSRYYADRPPVNEGETVITLNSKGKKTRVFKDNKNIRGEARQAVLIKHNIDGTTCKIGGSVPDNYYAAVKTKIDLDILETSCMLSKENCVLTGWKLKYKRGEKTIESKRLKIPGDTRCINENGEVIKTYSFFIPQSDCELSPIFESGKGANIKANANTHDTQIISTENDLFDM